MWDWVSHDFDRTMSQRVRSIGVSELHHYVMNFDVDPETTGVWSFQSDL
jgi:hypothetical protein